MMHEHEATPMADPLADPVAPDTKVIPREQPDNLPESRRAKIAMWQREIRADKAHWAPEFKRIRESMTFAKLGATAEWVEGKNYVANIIQRQVNNRVAELYAKNPRAVAQVRKRLNFKVWNGDPAALIAAQQMMMPALAGDPRASSAIELIQDVTQGMQQQAMYQKIADTLQILFHYFIDEQTPAFKTQVKRAVRRALVAGVAYCELGFQRILEKSPEISTQIEDTTRRLALMESLAADMADGQLQPDEAEMETLRVLLQELQSQETMIVREGPTFDWGVGATEIIVDRNCRQLQGFVGADHVVRERLMTPAKIQKTWGVDVRTGAPGVNTDNGELTPIVTADGHGEGMSESKDAPRSVWTVWDKRTGTEFVMADGWPDYIKEPAAPSVQVDNFYPVLVLEFNPVEDADTSATKNDGDRRRRIHGLSDVELIRDMQSEFNWARQGFREHRQANRPATIAARGSLDAADKAQLGAHAAHDLIEVNMPPNTKMSDVLQGKPVSPIDPALYDTSHIFDDIQRAAGSQDANFGKLTGSTATEASIAEGSRVGTSQSNIDDLDDVLTALARRTGQILFLNMSAEQVTKIVGPGAAWPELSAQEASEEVFLSIKAGSSGRPNKELELANFERVAPMLLQIPGIAPRWLVEQIIRRLDDDSISLEEAFTEGLPSIVAMNALQGGAGATGGPGAGTGPDSDPAAQGPQGGQNQPRQPEQQAGSQPAFPTGAPGVQ